MTDTADILKKIIARKYEEIEQRSEYCRLTELRSVVQSVPAGRGFVSAIEKQVERGFAAVIAEIKKASPSKGVIRQDFSSSQLAKSFELGGATCLSVLTDEDFFQGHRHYLQIARAATHLPVIRKDFIVDEYQVYEAKLLRADCILLIAAALDKQKLIDLNSLAHSLGMDVLVEVHNEEELEVALELPNKLIGINNRNLHNFNVSLQTTLDLLKRIPDERIVVTESGIQTKDDVNVMRKNNVNCFLVGESFMRDPNPGTKLKSLFF